jgi:hypothetical protein
MLTITSRGVRRSGGSGLEIKADSLIVDLRLEVNNSRLLGESRRLFVSAD